MRDFRSFSVKIDRFWREQGIFKGDGFDYRIRRWLSVHLMVEIQYLTF